MATSTRKCTGCHKRFRQSLKTWIKTPAGNFHTHKCAADTGLRRAKRKTERARKAAAKENRRKKREFYAKDIKTRREAAVYWFNRYIRLRDAGLGCISCGNNNPNIKYDAGHFIPAGSCSALRFDERNVNLQCSVRCNKHLSGNRSEYRRGLVRRYGEKAVQFLEGPQPKIKITAEWYKSIEDKYKSKCKEMESGAPKC